MARIELLALAPAMLRCCAVFVLAAAGETADGTGEAAFAMSQRSVAIRAARSAEEGESQLGCNHV